VRNFAAGAQLCKEMKIRQPLRGTRVRVEAVAMIRGLIASSLLDHTERNDEAFDDACEDDA
jgi:hypothetical protein